ncbi:HoxN/HupN/NixA family nickel/cobalt transporter [Athalassotoga saccharophila]|uniref:HoxN/HupN/NixA family nickel/cobalt transporter n=1 Tax=Athalassotoga saccharophila TaxID=1441386 RepID=UPI0014789B7F|nr:HoxN/HupN/NixA family nickel/cobalt transporter [Athalassotoga saccharophila]BBJ27409.1 high-affinity nickel transport protein [Athalassotoga saccharophila]
MFGSLKKRLIALFIILGTFNAIVWFLMVKMSILNSTLIGIGALAYFFGLRHAFDADHIAAIDNVTRKLRQEEKKPVGVGFFFSLGHSTVVILLSLALVFAIRDVKGQMGFLQQWGGLVGTIVSASFLTAIGLMNFVIFKRLRHIFIESKNGSKSEDVNKGIEELLNKRGFFSNIFRFLFKNIDKSWKMYPIGFLFGLGFDTATEVAILGISATMAQNGKMPVWEIMIFPFLFTAGMSLMDSLDGVAMLKAYDWAMVDGMRKLFFNMTITGMSVLVALIIGFIEWIQVIGLQLNLGGPFWNGIENLDFGVLGVIVVALMISTWIIAYLYYKKALSWRER